MALKTHTKLTRLQLEKDPDRLGIHGVLGTVRYVHLPAAIVSYTL